MGRLLTIAALLGVLTCGAAQAAGSAQWIVFSGQVGGSSLKPAQLFRVQTNGTGLTQVTKGGKGSATAPSFSPDGKKIVFVRLGEGIYRINFDGTGLRRLTENDRDSFPVWSPDGKRIAFLRIVKKNWRAFVMGPNGGKPKLLASAPPAGRPTWTANSKSLIVPAAGSLAKISASSGEVQAFYGAPVDPINGHSGTISPDGKSVTFVGTRVNFGAEDCGESRCPAFGLFLAPVKGGKKKRIANDAGPAGWAPDGKTVAFVATGVINVYTVANGKATKITVGVHTPDGTAPPAWQPR
jgi:Tol biopolymer transport system component